MKVDQDFKDIIVRQLDAVGITGYRFSMGGKHPKVEFIWQGQEKKFVFPGTSSDYRATRNMLRDLRRLLGLTGVHPAHDSAEPEEECPDMAMIGEIRQALLNHPPVSATDKDHRALELLDLAVFTSAVAIGRRAGAADPGRWGGERLERLVALGLAEGDGEGRYRRKG